MFVLSKTFKPRLSRFSPFRLRARKCLQWLSGEFAACEFGRVERRDQLLAWGLGGTSYSFTRQVPILRKYHLLTGSFLAFHIFWSCLFVKLDDGVDEEDFLKQNLRIF